MKEQDLQEIYDRAPHVNDEEFGVRRTLWISMPEARVLYEEAKAFEPDNIFESGTANGWSTLWLSRCSVPVFTFDPKNRDKVWEGTGVSNITYIEDKFETIVDRYAALKQGRNFFFIDGNHKSKGVRADAEALQEFGKKGDVVLFHDLQNGPVQREFDKLWPGATSSQIWKLPFPRTKYRDAHRKARREGTPLEIEFCIDYRKTGKIVL